MFAVLSLVIFGTVSLLDRCSGLSSDWKSHIDLEILTQYSGKDLDERFDPTVFEGDLMGIVINNKKDLQTVDNVYATPEIRWDLGMVPYNLTANFTEKEVKFLQTAMEKFTRRTQRCIKFVPRTIEPDFLSIIKGPSCFATVGFDLGPQILSVHEGCMDNRGDLYHLLMHVIGFYHENARKDRDDFVTVNRDNIAEGAQLYFEKYAPLPPDDSSLPYDIASITHLPFNAFAKDNKLPTVVPKADRALIGQDDDLTDLDVKKIKKAYDCTNGRGSPSRKDRKTLEADADATIQKELKMLKKKAEDEDDDDLSGVTPDPPDSATSSSMVMRRLHPEFAMRPITTQQCASLQTNNCQMVPGSKSCQGQTGFYASCSSSADAAEIKEFLNKIKKLDAGRGLELQLNGTRDFADEAFEPAREFMISLIIADYDNFDFAQLRPLRLPWITHLAVLNCQNMTLGLDDLLFIQKLTMFILAKSSFAHIADGAFEDLTFLQQVALDNGMLLKSGLGIAPRYLDHIRLLHCDCKYGWLRDFLDRKPYLLQARQTGEIHTWGGITSHEFTRRQNYIPVDCSKPDLMGAVDQKEFSINVKC